jgi:GH18 family chitinase
MGIQEKRFVKDLKETVVPQMQTSLKEITGHEITYDLDWPSFEKSLQALQNIQYQGMDRINSAFRDICSDDVGKEAVKEAIKKITLKNIEDPTKKSISLAKGILTVQCAWGSDDSDGYYTDSIIRQTLEPLL